MKETLAKDLDKFVLRMPDGLRDRIKSAADANNRSMNAEIIATLEDIYPDHQSLDEMIEYLRDLADDYKKSGNKNATILREIYDVINTIRFDIEQSHPDEG